MIVGHGIDIINVNRVDRLLARFPEKFSRRIYTAEEISYCQQQSVPGESFAARLAAKEAIYKVMSPCLEVLRWREINITCKNGGKPKVELRGRTNLVSQEMRITNWQISLSHEKEFAVASVIAEGGSD